jgi:glycerophosphoryl diester phosphodiesterase
VRRSAARRSIAILVLLVLALVAGARYSSRTVAEHPLFLALPDGPWVVAHRGGAGPENTLFSFHDALAQGADLLEMDVRSSADGVPVLLHDETVDRTTDGSGAVADLTLAQLKELDAAFHWTTDGGRTFPLRGQGIRIPTLAETLSAFPGQPLLLDLKAIDAAHLCTLLHSADMQQRVLVAAFRQWQITSFRRHCPEVATGLSRPEGKLLLALNALRLGRWAPLPAEAALFPQRIGPWSLITPRLLATAKERQLPVFVWTVDDPQEMRQLLDLGVEGLITRYPQRLRQLLSAAARPSSSGSTEGD